MTAELPKEMENKSDDRKVVEWKQQPGHENETLDCLVGCAVGAAMLGAELAGAQEPAKRSGRKSPPDRRTTGRTAMNGKGDKRRPMER